MQFARFYCIQIQSKTNRNSFFLFASACAAGFLSSSIGAHSLGAEGLEHITLTAPFGICYGVPSAWLWDLFILTLHRITESQNHRMVGLEGTPRLMKLQPPPQAGPPTSTLKTSPGCPGPIQPGLEHPQGWTGHLQPPWTAVSALHHSHSKNFSASPFLPANGCGSQPRSQGNPSRLCSIPAPSAVRGTCQRCSRGSHHGHW